MRKKGKRYKAVKCSGRRGKAVGILAKTRRRVSAVSKVWGQPEHIRVEHVKNGKAGMTVRKGAKLGSAKIGKNHVYADSVIKKKFGKNVAARKRGKHGDGGGGGIEIIDIHK